MNNQEKLFKPSDGLFDQIMSRIHEEQKIIMVKRRFAIFFVGLIGSMAAFMPAFKMMQTGFNESGFINFFSLFFTDIGMVMTYWRSFAMTLLGTLPLMSVATFLVIVFIFLESLKFLTQDMRIILKHAQIFNH
ncbi:MAG: hypothetical protein PHE59_02285 [Patescibacteria group bacterium]|nr:hypothetical protein [Patescibacteria group bacterium]MDD5164400.1 hypothetical protein [Patescibacteria group bacterium]MDD5534948.1 hypothetical protein [Patescibacteria group bacterium]